MKTASLLLFGLMSSLLCHAAGGRALVRLCERAGVAAETVRLSDFLPQGKSLEIRDEASSVELGHSPLLGSTRYFTREEIEQSLREHGGLLEQISIPERVVAFRAGWLVSPDLARRAITDFMASHNWKAHWFAASQMKMSGSPAATRPDPELTVKNVERDRIRGELRFAIGCVQRKECGTFLATVPEPKGFSASLHNRVHSPAGISPKIAKEILVRAGKPAMLNMHEGRMNISLRVICLERGTLGQTIRVRDASGQRVYRAKVVGASAVQADL